MKGLTMKNINYYTDRELKQAEEERYEESIYKNARDFLVRDILAPYGLEQHLDRFFEDQDGIAILANLCNLAAKRFCYKYYEDKPWLIEEACRDNPLCWQSEGIVYIETRVGQVSFHAFCGEDEGLPEANGKVWSEIPYQEHAPLVAIAYLEGWSKAQTQAAVLHQQAYWEQLHQKLYEDKLTYDEYKEKLEELWESYQTVADFQ
jgi:hypothetical protein